MNRRNDALRALAVLSALLLGSAYVAYSAGRAPSNPGSSTNPLVPRSPEFGIEQPASDTHVHGTKSAIIFDQTDAQEVERRRREILMSTSKSGRIFKPSDELTQPKQPAP